MAHIPERLVCLGQHSAIPSRGIESGPTGSGADVEHFLRGDAVSAVTLGGARPAGMHWGRSDLGLLCDRSEEELVVEKDGQRVMSRPVSFHDQGRWTGIGAAAYAISTDSSC